MNKKICLTKEGPLLQMESYTYPFANIVIYPFQYGQVYDEKKFYVVALMLSVTCGNNQILIQLTKTLLKAWRKTVCSHGVLQSTTATMR